jgi:hypothetical protein
MKLIKNQLKKRKSQNHKRTKNKSIVNKQTVRRKWTGNQTKPLPTKRKVAINIILDITKPAPPSNKKPDRPVTGQPVDKKPTTADKKPPVVTGGRVSTGVDKKDPKANLKTKT